MGSAYRLIGTRWRKRNKLKKFDIGNYGEDGQLTCVRVEEMRANVVDMALAFRSFSIAELNRK